MVEGVNDYEIILFSKAPLLTRLRHLFTTKLYQSIEESDMLILTKVAITKSGKADSLMMVIVKKKSKADEIMLDLAEQEFRNMQ